MIRLVCLITVGVLFSFCSDKEQNHGKNWINLEYVNCLKVALPCECLEKINVTALFLDTNEVGLYVYEKNTDYNVLKFKEEDGGRFKVFKEGGASSVGNIIIASDTLYFNYKNLTERFVNFSEYEKYDHSEYLGKVNMELINKSLKSRSYEILNDILPKDNYNLYCNYSLQGVNLLSVSGKCENKWLLEQVGDSLYIYEYLNSCDGKSNPPKIDKRIVKSILW